MEDERNNALFPGYTKYQHMSYMYDENTVYKVLLKSKGRQVEFLPHIPGHAEESGLLKAGGKGQKNRGKIE
jgi:hypothetical protein